MKKPVVLWALILAISIILLEGCKKEAKKYTGDFDFTICRFYWCMYPELDRWDTTYYSGSIKLLKKDTLLINYALNSTKSTKVSSDGQFPEIYAYHYHFRGGFISENEIKFYFEDGGLGSGYEWTIYGVRK